MREREILIKKRQPSSYDKKLLAPLKGTNFVAAKGQYETTHKQHRQEEKSSNI
jgi:hypothetical protein